MNVFETKKEEHRVWKAVSFGWSIIKYSVAFTFN